jgi:hypothetical protein
LLVWLEKSALSVEGLKYVDVLQEGLIQFGTDNNYEK